MNKFSSAVTATSTVVPATDSSPRSSPRCNSSHPIPPPKPDLPESGERAGSYLARWRAPLFLAVCSTLLFLFLSGFLIFFFGSFLERRAIIATVHWMVGAVTFPVVVRYLWLHYRRMGALKHTTRYQTGFALGVVVLATSVSGAPIIDQRPFDLSMRLIDLLHLMLGFAFGIMLSVHLVLVVRARLLREGGRDRGTVRAPVGALMMCSGIAVILLALVAHGWPIL